MPPFSHPFRWQIWPRLWCFISTFVAHIKQLQYQFNWSTKTLPNEDVERQPEQSVEATLKDSSNFTIIRHTIKSSSSRKLLMVSAFAEVYLLNGTVVRKVPCGEGEDYVQPLQREAAIYEILGQHPRIAEHLSPGRTDCVDIKYYPHGDLAAHIQQDKGNVTTELQSKWFMQMIEAVVKIHDHGIVHSDLASRQFFLDIDLNLRLGDFNASQYPGHAALGFEKATHCLPRDYAAPNTTASDLFALGSTLYELVAGKAPYSELYPVESEDMLRSTDPIDIQAQTQREQQADLEIETRYQNHDFPDVTCLFGGEIIMGCWNGSIPSAKEALIQYRMLIKDAQNKNME